MYINAIGSNNNNFGAKIKFENPKFRQTLPNITDYKYANNILRRIDEYHPNDKVVIRMINAANQNDSCMEAVNQSTQKAMRQRLLLSDYNKDFESESGSNTFYALLEYMLDKSKSDHNIFWGGGTKYKSEPSPNENPVFI